MTRVPEVGSVVGSSTKETEVTLAVLKPGKAIFKSASVMCRKLLAAVMPVKSKDTVRYCGLVPVQAAMQRSSETETFNLLAPETTLKTISLLPVERLGLAVPVKAMMAPPKTSGSGAAGLE